MKWSDSIPFRQPLREVRLLTQAPGAGLAASICASANRPPLSAAGATARTRCDEQLLQQRNETVELQKRHPGFAAAHRAAR